MRSCARVVLGGVVTGPALGWLGHLWWARGARWAGPAVAAALSLEPLARHAAGDPIRSGRVLLAEVLAGALAALWLAARPGRRTRPGPAAPR